MFRRWAECSRFKRDIPEGGAILINRFGDYEDQPYIVVVRTEKNDAFQLQARPFHHQGGTLSTRVVKWSGIVKAMKALHLPEPQISTIRNSLQQTHEVEIGGRAGEQDFSNYGFGSGGI